MASLRFLAFDHEGRPLQFDTWLDDLQLYLLSDIKDSVSLFDHVSGAATAPPATADTATRSQWLSRNAAARLAIRNHLPLTECAHFGQHRTAQALYDTVVARNSSPAIAALGRLLLPYLFPELSAFATIEDLVSHLCASDARYRAAVPAEDHFLSLDPTSLTVDLLEQHLLTAETSAVAVGAARGTPRPPFFEGCSPSPLAPSYASAAAADVSFAEDVRAASASAKCRSGKGKGGKGGGDGSGGGGGGSGSSGGGSSGGGGGGGAGGGSGGSGGSSGGSGGSGGGGGNGSGDSGTGARRTCGRLQTQHHYFSRLDDAWRAEFGDNIELPCWADLLRSRIAIFDLDFDAILSAMYALSVSAEGDCYRCVPPDPGIAAAALCASESVTLPSTAPAQALHTFMLDSGTSTCFFRDSTTLTPLSTPVPVRLADPSGGPIVARSSTVLPCLAVAASCSCRLLSHQNLLWHHRLGHPSLPRLRGMHFCLLVSGLPRFLPLLPPLPAPPCLPYVEGRQRAAPHSSSFPPMTAPLQTLHMDVWGPAHISGQSRERYFLLDLPVLRLHSDRGGEFCSSLLRDFCRGEGILQSFTLPDSPQQNGIAERHIGLVMEVARTSMIHAASPHFLWPFVVRYAAHQLNLWPRSRAFVRDTSVDKLSLHAIPCVFLGFVPDAPGWQFYHPTLHHDVPSQDVTFDESVPFYRLFPYRSAPPPPPPLFLAPGPPLVDPLPPQGPAPSSVSQIDPLSGPAPVQVVVGSGAEPGDAESEGAETGDAEPGGVVIGGGEPGGIEPEGVEPGGAASEGAESGGAEPQVAASSGGSAGASPRMSPQQLREWFVRRARVGSGASGAGVAGAAGAGGTGVAAGAGVPGGTVAAGSGGARTRGTGAAGNGGVEGAGAGDLTESGTTGAGGAGAGEAGVGGTGTGGTGVVDPGVGDAGTGGAGAVYPDGTVLPQSYFVPLLQQVLGTTSSSSLTPPLLCPLPDQSQPPLQPASSMPAPSPYPEKCGSLTDRREPASRPVLPVRTARRVPSSRPPPVPGTHAMTLRPSSVPLHVPLPAPPESSLPAVPDPECDHARAASPAVSHLLTTAVTDPSFESATTTALVAESASADLPTVGGESALGTDVFEDRQEDFECLAAAVPRLTFMLLAPEGDPDAPDIPTPRSNAEAITGPYSSQWQAAMDADMASWKFIGTYVDEVTPPGANIVDGMWIFRVKWSPGSPPAFKARYVARGFSTQWSLRRPVHGLRQAPREWYDTLRTTLAALGFAPATADPSLFLRSDTSLPPFCVLVYIDDLVFATADTEALTLVTSELQKRHTYTDLGEVRSYLGLQITRDRARRNITLTQSHMVHQVLQPFFFQFSSPQPTPLSTWHWLSAPPSDESVEPSGPYPELVGCLISSSEAEIYAGAMAAQELRWLTYLLSDLGEHPRSPPVLAAFLQGSLHEEICLRRPPGFTGSFPAGTQWSLRRPVYGLRQAPREWHDTLKTTLAALGFAPSTSDPFLFLHTDTTLPTFYVLVYVDDLVFATADTEALAHVKSELQKRHTCTDLGEITSYLGLRITRDRAQRTITLTQSHMVQQVLQRFGFTYSSPQSSPLPTGHSLSAPPSDESVEPSGPYPELVGCLMHLMTCTRPDLAYPLSLLAHYVAPGRDQKVHWDAAKRVLRYLCSTSGMGLVLGGWAQVVLTDHADASLVDDLATQRSSQGYTFSLGSGSVSWRSTRSSSVLSSSFEAEIFTGAMAAHELRWLTYLVTDLGEAPRSPPVLYVDNKAMLALCQEHRLEHRMKHIALCYFLA
ncbi:unnamed protein product [Closterium sp. NIES-54]